MDIANFNPLIEEMKPGKPQSTPVRRFPGARKSGIFENVGIFGRPIKDGRIEVTCINRVMLHKVQYDIHFGPARRKHIYVEELSTGEEPDQVV